MPSLNGAKIVSGDSAPLHRSDKMMKCFGIFYNKWHFVIK